MLFNIASAQSGKKIIKISYSAYPISTIDTPPQNSPLFAGQEASVALAQSYKYKYSLYINTETNESIYKLDTLIRENVPVGKEKVRFMVNNNLDYVVRDANGAYFKYEKIFQREFYSEGGLKDIDWDITNETKMISGMNCRKAVSKKKAFYITVWFTDDIPISSGPVNFFGLPGLVVWSEDFSWTTEIEKVAYLDQFDFATETNKLKVKFDQNKKGKFIKEDLLLVQKADLVESMLAHLRQ